MNLYWYSLISSSSSLSDMNLYHICICCMHIIWEFLYAYDMRVEKMNLYWYSLISSSSSLSDIWAGVNLIKGGNWSLKNPWTYSHLPSSIRLWISWSGLAYAYIKILNDLFNMHIYIQIFIQLIMEWILNQI
jgi:hypothetical protein